MNKITFPLQMQMTGAAVADLQAALQTFLDRALILPNDEGARRELSRALSRERPNQSYGSATSKLVDRFQEEQRLEIRGAVDEPTAKALNGLLRQLGLLDATDAGVERQRVVSGRVRRSDQLPFSGVVRALHVGERGTIRLGDDETDAE